MSPFVDVIERLSTIFDLDLYVDKNQACKLNFNEKVTLQIEMDVAQDRLIIGSMIDTIPPGKYREEVLKYALKANHILNKDPGILSYVKRKNALFIFDYLYYSSYTDKEIEEFFQEFVAKATNWKEALKSGTKAPNDILALQVEKPISPFGP